jgi:(R,R)-butanediol dehydrogenase/meso-butanediol dehydrogenase/diacetyl reductase
MRVATDVSIGKYPGFEKMVTSRIHLEDVVDGGFVELTENKDKHVKIMVTPKRELLE